MFALVNIGARPMFYSNPWVNFYYDMHMKIQKQVLNAFIDYQITIHDKQWEIINQIILKNLKKPAEFRCLLSDNYDCLSYEMSPQELKEYNTAQIEEIKKYKVYLEDKHQDQFEMNEVVIIWADKYSHTFRKHWHLQKLISI